MNIYMEKKEIDFIFFIIYYNKLKRDIVIKISSKFWEVNIVFLD